jgi:hypothetical protein
LATPVPHTLEQKFFYPVHLKTRKNRHCEPRSGVAIQVRERSQALFTILDCHAAQEGGSQ